MEFDPIETCPYDPVHRIRRSRMQFHITICSKNYPSSKMMQCPFDARHKVNQVEFEYHKSYCPARESVISYAIHDTISQAEQKILPIDVNPVGVSDENWDEGVSVKTYNPFQAIQNKPIVYPVIGLSKAKRKYHRLQERMRFNQIMENSVNQSKNQTDALSNNSNMQSEQSFSVKSSNNKDDTDEQEYKPLRRPFPIGKRIANASQDKTQKPTLPVHENSEEISPIGDKTSHAPFSYAAALSKKAKNPALKKSKDDSIFDKLSKTLEEIVVNDEGHKKKTESLDKQINLLKKSPSEKKTKAT